MPSFDTDFLHTYYTSGNILDSEDKATNIIATHPLLTSIDSSIFNRSADDYIILAWRE